MTYLLSFKMRVPLDVPVETAGTSKNPMRKFALLSFWNPVTRESHRG